jgi:hypothetical protein
MLYIERDKLLKPHLDRREELEVRAGIKPQVERAREGSLFPLGIEGERVSPDLYFADESDYTRRKIRQAYFSVADLDLRREMMQLQVKIEEILVSFGDREIEEKLAELSMAKAKVRRLPWGAGAAIAMGCFAIGSYSKGEIGAIGGAVFGVFMGLWFVWNSKGDAEKDREQAEADLEQARKDRKIENMHPPTFSRSEASSGEEDREFGAESAYGKVAQFERTAA